MQLPKLLELVGLGYSAWFVYRYLLFKVSLSTTLSPYVLLNDLDMQLAVLALQQRASILSPVDLTIHRFLGSWSHACPHC